MWALSPMIFRGNQMVHQWNKKVIALVTWKGSFLSQTLTAMEEHVFISSFCLFIVLQQTSSHLYSASRGYLFAVMYGCAKRACLLHNATTYRVRSKPLLTEFERLALANAAGRKIQWNPDITSCQGSSKIVSLYREIVISKLPI